MAATAARSPATEGEANTNAGSGARSKTAVRRYNLSAALQAIHDHGPLPRTQLIELLGLGRTTVFELLSHLASIGLIEDGPPVARAGAGRPSLLVRASSAVGALVVNPEVDALTVGIVSLDGQVLVKSRAWAPRDPRSTARLAAQLLAGLRRDEAAPSQIVGVGAAIPGQVAADTRVTLSAPSLGWQHADFTALLAAELGVPAYAENNARLVTTVEQRTGLAKGYRDFIYVFAGAGGIGGGIVSDGHLLSGKGGFAGELGHMQVAASGDGHSRPLETLICRDAIVAALGHQELDDATLERLMASATSHSFVGTAQRQLAALGVALGNLANALDPRLLLLGGFLGPLYRRFPGALEDTVRSVALPAVMDALEIRPASHTIDSVLRGAAELVFSALTADPLTHLASLAPVAPDGPDR